MYDVYLTYLTDTPEDSAHPVRVAELVELADRDSAATLCIALHPYLRDGVEAHFKGTDD